MWIQSLQNNLSPILPLHPTAAAFLGGRIISHVDYQQEFPEESSFTTRPHTSPYGPSLTHCSYHLSDTTSPLPTGTSTTSSYFNHTKLLAASLNLLFYACFILLFAMCFFCTYSAHLPIPSQVNFYSNFKIQHRSVLTLPSPRRSSTLPLGAPQASIIVLTR